MRAIENRLVLGQCVPIIVGDFLRCVLRLHLQDDELKPKRGAPQPELRCWAIVVLILIFVRYRSRVNGQAHFFAVARALTIDPASVSGPCTVTENSFVACVLLRLFLCPERIRRDDRYSSEWLFSLMCSGAHACAAQKYVSGAHLISLST